MTLRSLLVPVSGHPADEIVLDTAFSLGQTFDSHISAVCIRPDPVDVVRYVAEWSYPILIDDAVATAERHASELARAASTMFNEWRQRHGLPVAVAAAKSPGVSVSWCERVGASGTVLRDLSRFADLIVMRSLGEQGPIEGDIMLESVLFEAGRPALIVPGKPVQSLFGGALIAWDGGREALRAVTAALPILARMRRVKILTIDGDSDVKAEELASYLAWHGIVAEIRDADGGSTTVGETVLHEVREMGAGLLVMGGYHHSRAREIVFGGTTRHVVAASEIPVLLAH